MVPFTPPQLGGSQSLIAAQVAAAASQGAPLPAPGPGGPPTAQPQKPAWLIAELELLHGLGAKPATIAALVADLTAWLTT